MIERDDIRSAVSAGILSEDQASNLIALSDRRRGVRDQVSVTDEPFELFRGFNEIFIVFGLLVLTFGWICVSVFTFTGNANQMKQAIVPVGFGGGAIFWLLSEYFVRRRRMVAPAICLTLLFGANAVFSSAVLLNSLDRLRSEDYTWWLVPLTFSTVALGIYWLRFRVPFAMALIALGLFAVAILCAAKMSGTSTTLEEMFLLSADGSFAWITLALGAAVFIVAMIFDTSDPHRVSIRAANGFWLHVVAAPALVNTMALTLLARDDAISSLLLLVVLSAFAYIAVVIDRRSFLMATIAYIVVLAFTLVGGEGATASILVLGTMLLLLGAYWERVRAVFLRTLPGFISRDRLPPSI